MKERFTTAPILSVPDPQPPFVVEVYASNQGIAAVLSQRAAKDNKMHPCAYLSRKLTAAEKKPMMWGILLAFKTALEKWRHWLELAEQPFVVWTDHNILEYQES